MKVAFGNHFNKKEMAYFLIPYVRDKTTIVCPACQKEVEGRSGLRNDAVLRHHMFYLCHKYRSLENCLWLNDEESNNNLNREDQNKHDLTLVEENDDDEEEEEVDQKALGKQIWIKNLTKGRQPFPTRFEDLTGYSTKYALERKGREMMKKTGLLAAQHLVKVKTTRTDGVDDSEQMGDGYLSIGIFNGKLYPVAIGQAASQIFSKPELIRDIFMDPGRVKNLNPEFSDQRLNTLLEQSSADTIATPAKSKRKDYKGISAKNKKKPVKKPVKQPRKEQPQPDPVIEKEPSISSISSADDTPAARTVMSLLKQKLSATSEAARKRKISQLVESQESQESDDEVERPRQKKLRGGNTGPGVHGRGVRGRGHGKN